MIAPVLQHQLCAERPTHQPGVREGSRRDEVHGGGDVERFVPTTVEGSLAGSSRGGRASGVEPQNREVRESGQTTGRLPEDMGVHEPARGGERMTGHQGGDRVPVAWNGEFADQGQTVDRLQFDVLPARGQKHRSTDLHLS